ncbi:hypothetical protein BDB01DRAFT_839116 [Pilobolus umbonatus]|nr:hypothetical protein BDB01DRAFT_839111 [Pilobolus umbonatus]KAI8972937.1 hypothetical protein BDB01DRAFT_839116 [Pilobolus umbonatus]
MGHETAMEHLPYEIIEQITLLLSTKDHLNCLTVNKFWYSIFIRLVYKRVVFWTRSKLELFLQSITSYPRSAEGGNYIRQFEMSLLKHTEKCLVVFSESDILKVLTNPVTPKKLKNICFASGFTLDTIDSEAMDCLYHFRSTLTCLRLDKASHALSEHTLLSLVSYLTEFRCLEKLQIDLTDTPFGNSSMLDLILHHCPKLTRVHFESNTLNCPANTSIQSYPNIKKLLIRVDMMHLNDAYYLRDNLTQLKKFKLVIKRSIHNEEKVLNALMNIRSLDRFKMKMPFTLSKYAFDEFWKHAALPSQFLQERDTNKAVFTVLNSSKSLSDLLFVKCPITGRRKSSAMMIMSTQTKPSCQEYLEENGWLFNQLDIRNDMNQSNISLENINRLCPVLSRLVMREIDLTAPSSMIAPNNNLLSLMLDQCELSTFRNIETAYPNLQNLKLESADFRSGSAENTTFQLPDTGLIYLEINKVKMMGLMCNVAIITEIDGVVIRSWHYNRRSNKTIVLESESTEIQQLPNQPFLILRSSTLKTVHFM